MKSRLDPAREPWMRTKEVCAVMNALREEGGDARFVGGAVRDALLGRAVDNIDIATPLVPEEVTRRLRRANIAALPTGIEHGTVTAVLDGCALEVTTLRRDVSTDGRRAVVAFSESWEEDAGRRDFTFNALYASLDGALFDYQGGLEDLAAGYVRFIGDPVQRIREDYLRILRFFRMHAWYGRGELDDNALKAATSERRGLAALSGERIRKEFLRLLEADDPVAAVLAMQRHKILPEILPGETYLKRFERLVAVDSSNFFIPDSTLRLIALVKRNDPSARLLTERLKLSGDERDRLLDLVADRQELTPYLPVREVRRMLYRLDKQRFRDRVLLAWAGDADQSNTIAWRALLALADAWECPPFPVSGRDVMAAGIPEGPLVGRILAEVETWWIDNDFTDDSFALAECLEVAVQKARSSNSP